MTLASAAFGRIATWRRARYERHPHWRRALARPVVSVGNLRVGGSGKTPVVVTVASLLRAAGERPSILSRGYGRRDTRPGVCVVSDGERVLEPVERSGDEPQLLARAVPGVPVLVCEDRYLAGRLAEGRFGATVHVLDDGFQHLTLARDVDLLLVSPADLCDLPLPSGRLREPIDAGRAAHALLVAGGDADVAEVAAAIPVSPAFTVTTVVGSIRPCRPEGPEWTPGASPSVAAVAAIARPERFRETVRAQGWDVASWRTFRDHHWFTARDVTRCEAEARAAGAQAVVTTEKDAVRLEGLLAAATLPWVYLPIRADVLPADAFVRWLAERLVAARAAGAARP